MNNEFKLNYIKCPICNNVLNMSFVDGICPNPLCSFDFKGLEPLLDETDIKLHKQLEEAEKSQNEAKIKLLEAAIRFNMGQFLSHYISCGLVAHYRTLFRNFIIPYLDDLNVLKLVLLSDVIKPDKYNTAMSRNGYKMFWELYKNLVKIHNRDIRSFLKYEFPIFYIKHLKLFRTSRQP